MILRILKIEMIKWDEGLFTNLQIRLSIPEESSLLSLLNDPNIFTDAGEEHITDCGLQSALLLNAS